MKLKDVDWKLVRLFDGSTISPNSFKHVSLPQIEEMMGIDVMPGEAEGYYIETSRKREEYYKATAKMIARSSPCRWRHYGALITCGYDIISAGCNWPKKTDVWKKHCEFSKCIMEDGKHNLSMCVECLAEHPVDHAIREAKKYEKEPNWVNLKDCTIYIYCEENGKMIDVELCPKCEELIKQSGIKRVVKSRW